MKIGEIVYVRYNSTWYEAKLIALNTTATVQWMRGRYATSTTTNVPLENIFPMESITKKQSQDASTQVVQTQDAISIRAIEQLHQELRTMRQEVFTKLHQELRTMRQEVFTKLREIRSLVFFDPEEFIGTFD